MTTTTTTSTDFPLDQLAPLVIVLVVPLLVLYGRNYLSEFAFHMITVASSALPWNWSSIYEHASIIAKPKKKPAVRTRTEQLAARTDGRPVNNDASEGEKGLFYPGLVNISGTYCFMNSTMQTPFTAKAEAVDIPTPVVDALRDLLHGLNIPSSYYRSLRPVEMIAALSHPEPGRRSPLFSSREHQDAQELFQLVSEYIKKEATEVDREGARDLGLGALASLSSSSSSSATPVTTSVDVSKGVFDGLTANRRSCCECGYTEAVMHFPFDNWQLAVPRVASCRIEECLVDYTRLEILTDCICRKCSMRMTLHRLEQDAERLAAEVSKSESVSNSKKKRLREVRRFALRLKTALEEGRIEEDIKGVKIEKVFSRASTKQAMVARPPPVLALHLNRSVHFGTYASKNTARVHFPEVLDLTPFTTSGMLSTSPSFPISSHPHAPSPTAAVAAATSLSTKTAKAYNHNLAPQPPRVLYRLAAVVCHYGQHSFGHYVCYRRKPRGSVRVGPPRLNDGFHATPGRGWLRASDDAVREVGIETVLQEGSGAFMLYYERVRNEDKPSVPVWSSHSRTTTTDDDEDNDNDLGGIDDDDDSGQDNARTHRSQQDVVKCEVDDEMGEVPVIKARVVRSVSLGAGDDFEGAWVSVKHEAEVEKGERERDGDGDGDDGRDSEARLSRSRTSSPTPAKPENVEVEPTVELLPPTSSVSTEVPSPSPIPDAPAMDEPPIGAVPQSVDLRA
ncbi:hypothetical protein F5888DRAFT_1791978 [Russula emetica]|nr:hypothetical protein F5888DRAFT_1791978 [Russula emetica]